MVEADPGVGLCSVCTHARVVVSGRGSKFWMCELSARDGRFRKYPPLPVVQCHGFEQVNDTEGPANSSGEL